MVIILNLDTPDHDQDEQGPDDFAHRESMLQGLTLGTELDVTV